MLGNEKCDKRLICTACNVSVIVYQVRQEWNMYMRQVLDHNTKINLIKINFEAEICE
jgi:hypothetical protein